MGIEYRAEGRLFHLTTCRTSYLFQIGDHGDLRGQYYGKRLRTTDLSRLRQVYATGFSPVYEDAPDGSHSQDLLPSEYPVYGHGDYHAPALQAAFPNGSRLLDLRYHSHIVSEGTPELPGLPGLHAGDATLTVLLEDRPTGLQVELRYGVFERIDVITRSAVIHNRTGGPVRLLEALSMSLDLPVGDFDMIGLTGAHLREREIDRKPLRVGTQALESRRGASSHHENPFIALCGRNAGEESGEVIGAALVYSGNFVCSAEADAFGWVRLQLGINPFDFSWRLEDGESFVTPQAVLTYSDRGLSGMSRSFHAAVRNHLGHSRFRGQRPPIVINNWEATYFDFNENKLLDIIRSCDGLGIDLFVLDDGWFGRRDRDDSSLGDWFADPRKLPRGLTPLIEQCEAQGMGFGLWFEPEMISEDSELYRAHPDWCIRQEGRPYCRGRQQLIPDLSRRDVLEYLRETIGAVLRENRISYVKWDMNRHMTDAYSACLPPERQPEIYHRYMLHLYELLDALTTAFPDVLFEGCSGGGGRFDLGMLYYHPQIWTSDNSDAVARLRIQYGTSLVYPPECMAAHVSAVPNHQMGRMTPFATRGTVAMSGAFGYELDPTRLTGEEREAVVRQTARYRALADLVVGGDYYRLTSPFEGDDCCWTHVLPDRSAAVIVFVRQLARPARVGVRIRAAGLNPDASYYVEELDRVLGGDELMYAGITVPELKDFEARTYTLRRTER